MLSKNSIWQLLWQMIRYAQRLYWVDTLLWLGIIGLPVVPGLLIQQFFNSLTKETSTSESSWVWIGLLLATGTARVVVIFLGRITKTQHRFLMSGLVRHNLLLGLLNQPGAELASGRANGQKTSPGELLSYFRDDASQIENTVVSTNEIFAAAVYALIAVSLLLSVNPTMTLLVFVPLCAIAILVHRAEHRLKRYRFASRQATQQVTGLIGELFTAVQAIKVAGAEAQMLNELTRRCDRRRQLMVRDQVFIALLNSGFETIVSLGTGLILLLASQNLGTQGNLTVGDFALFVYYLSFITYFFAFLGGFLAITKHSEVSFERMAQLVGRSSALTHSHPLYLKPIFGTTEPLQSCSQMAAQEPLQEFRAEGLTYYYPGYDSQQNDKAERGIANISLTLTCGSLTVITGRVGSGKTTLLRVLLGLLPMQSGQLLWNGQEINDPANFLVPPHAAYTPQIPQLFSTSLRDNLLLGMADNKLDEWESSIVERQLVQAISNAVFDQDLVAMPDGLDTLIGTRGFRLSGGQKQRVAAARMLLRQPQLLVFDDLSSALDVETEQRLWQQLLGEKNKVAANSPHHRVIPSPRHPAILAVSHRSSVINRADQVIVLESGQIVFAGSPQDFFEWHKLSD